MILTPAEEQTLRFYLWEINGRGWEVADSEVELEPPFQPYAHSQSFLDQLTYGDTKEVFLHSLMQGFADGWKSRMPDPVRPARVVGTSELPHPIVISLCRSSDEEISIDQVGQFLTSLSYRKLPVGFELVGSASSINPQFACFEPDYEIVRQMIYAHFPTIVATVGADSLQTQWKQSLPTVIVEFGLEEEFMRPLRTVKSMDPDPLAAIVGAMEGCDGEEIGVLQILFQSTRSPWVESIMRSVSDAHGNPLFTNAHDMVSLAREKVRHPLFACVARIAVQATTIERAKDIARNLASGLRSSARPESNSLTPLHGVTTLSSDLLRRTNHRRGMICNAMELATLVHPLSGSVYSQKLSRSAHKSIALPRIAAGHAFILGENVHREKRSKASLSTEHRLRHVHIIGKTGTGKSTLIANMVRQDMEAGGGVAVLDPHGDLIDRIVELVPEGRVEDTILLDPSDAGHPVGFNILEDNSELERMVLSSDLVDLFRRYSTSWGDQMSAVLSNAIAAILEGSADGTLIELKRFLLEKEFRSTFLRNGVDPDIVYFWEKEFPLLKGSSQLSIITRLDAFLRSKLVRNVICQRKGLDFRDLVNRGNILLVKLSQGLIGEENAHLLGSLICSKLHQVVMGRQAVDEGERQPFFCYLDEFQHFATPSMASMLSSSRKYGFGLVLAHQDLQQISDSALLNSVITNPAVRICFALGDSDAVKLQSGFGHFEASDLMNLGVGEAVVRVERREYDFNMRTCESPSVTHDVAAMRRKNVIALTRERYGLQSTRVEAPRSPAATKEEQPAFVLPEELAKPTPTIPGHASVPEISPLPPGDLASPQRQSQHRYLQTLIKRMAEERGYRAVIEEPTPNGAGRVDIGLEGNGERIACEIAVTTTDEHEMRNIGKCLVAGYDAVVVCSDETKRLERLRALTSKTFGPDDASRLSFLEPQELFAFLERPGPKPAIEEKRIKGYRVKVEYQDVHESERQHKRDAVAQVILQSMRRMKDR